MRITNPRAVLGEDTACKYLQKKGYRIIERNFRKKYAEIDIIALHQKTLVFIEVKTRSNQSFGSPFDSIAPWKLRNLVKTAEFYKILHPNLPANMRIDAIGVTLFDDIVDNIEHLENISDF